MKLIFKRFKFGFKYRIRTVLEYLDLHAAAQRASSRTGTPSLQRLTPWWIAHAQAYHHACGVLMASSSSSSSLALGAR